MSESSIRQLADEHVYVKLVVGAMHDEVASIERTGRVHTERVAQTIDFTRDFTDSDHHAKEEDLLFARVEAEEGSAATRERYHATAHALAMPPADRETNRG